MRFGVGLVRLTVRPVGGQGHPYDDSLVATARDLVETTRLTKKEIAARIGVSAMSVGRWARAGRWQRPPGSARAPDEHGVSWRAMQRHGARMKPWRLLEQAEAHVMASVGEGGLDLDRLEHALALCLEARALYERGVGPKRSGHRGDTGGVAEIAQRRNG